MRNAASSRHGPPSTRKPPPTSGAITRTRSGASASSRATSSRIRWGTCVDDQIVSRSSAQRAATARGSSGTPASRACRTSTATVRCAAANARAGSPARTATLKQRLSSRPTTGGAPGARAAAGRAAHEDDVSDALDAKVVEEPTLAAQQRRVLAAARGTADVGHGAAGLYNHAHVSRVGWLRPRRRPPGVGADRRHRPGLRRRVAAAGFHDRPGIRRRHRARRPRRPRQRQRHVEPRSPARRAPIAAEARAPLARRDRRGHRAGRRRSRPGQLRRVARLHVHRLGTARAARAQPEPARPADPGRRAARDRVVRLLRAPRRAAAGGHRLARLDPGHAADGRSALGAEPHAPRARPDHAEARDVARGRLLGPAQRALGVLGRPRLGRVLPALSRASREHRPPRARVLAAARELPRRRPPAHRGDRAGRRHAAWQPAARRHRDRHAAAQHGGPGAAGAQGVLRVLPRRLRVAAGADLARPADPRQPHGSLDGQRRGAPARALAAAPGPRPRRSRADPHVRAARRDQARPVHVRRRGAAVRHAGRAASPRLRRRAVHARPTRDAPPAGAGAERRLAHRRAPLGHRAVRGRDRAGRRARRGRRLSRAPLACERAGLSPRLRSPLASWFAGPAARRRFRQRVLGRRVALLSARDDAWRALAPGFAGAVALARAGVPFQTALERRYDRTGDPRRLARALERGATVYLPQVHQILPRVARLMVALRAELLGARREECSFLFLVEGHGRAGMGLHHDGEVDAFWLQLEGRRTVTLGPPVAPRTRLDLPLRRDTGSGWRTLDLPPGSLLYLPPRTPHDVVCHGRSLALSLTWSRRRAHAGRAAWDVASGRAEPRPRRDRRWLWTQVPVTAGALDRARGRFRLHTPEGVAWLPARARPLAIRLADMPAVATDARAAAPLVALGVLAPEDLPLALVPDAPRALDGWRFA